ncbi:MAG: hypothetical protein U5J62_01005 [Desulfurivibrio sp.]|nr:hypothetical protein [Desulfurivibrio sp.]
MIEGSKMPTINNQKNMAAVASTGGAIFCVLNLLGVGIPLCETSGCELHGEIRILGQSLYLYGAIFFATTAIVLGVFSAKQEGGKEAILGLWLSAGLVINAGLLVTQAATVPCNSCLVVAGLLGLTAWLARSVCKLPPKLLQAWALLFLIALFGLVRQAAGPIAIHGDDSATFRIFFAPSCPACQDKLDELASFPELADHIAIYPVTLQPGDTAHLVRMQKAIEAGEPWSAVVKSGRGEANKPSWSEQWRMNFLTWRNKAFMAGIGASSVPYTLTSAGLPIETDGARAIDSLGLDIGCPSASEGQHPPLAGDEPASCQEQKQDTPFLLRMEGGPGEVSAQ